MLATIFQPYIQLTGAIPREFSYPNPSPAEGRQGMKNLLCRSPKIMFHQKMDDDSPTGTCSGPVKYSPYRDRLEHKAD